MADTRFWIKQANGFERNNLDGLRELVGYLNIQKQTIKPETTTYRIDIPEQEAEKAFSYCLRKMQSGAIITFWTRSDLEEEE